MGEIELKAECTKEVDKDTVLAFFYVVASSQISPLMF